MCKERGEIARYWCKNYEPICLSFIVYTCYLNEFKITFSISPLCRNISECCYNHYFNGTACAGMETLSYDVKLFYDTFSNAIQTYIEVASFLKYSR